jgi:alpha-tubulin suppressor-like RCC1 family protein
VSWGNRSYGQLGDGLTLTDPNSGTPLLTVGLSNVAVIAGGEHFSLALENDGTVLTWGDYEGGRLGLSPVPTLNVKTASVVAIY